MKSNSSQNQYKPYRFFGLYLGIAVCIFVWLLSIFSLLDRPTNFLYDAYSRHLPAHQHTSDPILLVEAAYHYYYEDDDVWLELVNILEANGAKQIIFTFFPPGVSSTFYERAAELEYIVFGRRVISSVTDSPSEVFEPLPSASKGYSLATGAFLKPREVNGLHRDYRSQTGATDNPLPSLALAAADQLSTINYHPPAQFRVNFIGEPEQLPTIDIDVLYSKNLISELIEDKTILIGLASPYPFLGYNTPLLQNKVISPLEYQGRALQTIVADRILRFPLPWEILVCLFLISCLNLITHQLLGTFTHVIISICFLGSLVLLNGFFVYVFQLWIPIVEIFLVYSLFQTLLAFRDNLHRNKIALQIILDQSFKRREQVMPKSFFRSEDYWSLVVNMVNQTLNLKRFIFLEAVEGDHRVKEVIALNCSLDDIKERRRDYHRTPYKTALEQNCSIPVDSYFTEIPELETSYIVPLNFAGQVQGFWAFTHDIKDEKQRTTLLATVNNFANEIGEMLFRRKQWIEQSRWYEHPLRKVLNMERQNEPYREVNRILAFLVRRLSILESVFNALDTATILYNPFGVVIQSNNKMVTLLKSLGMNAYELSALDLAVQITSISSERIRQHLGRVIIDYETVQLPISVTEDKSQTLMLRIRPLIAATKEEDDELPFQPIELNGILFEITDVSALMDINRIRESLFHYSLTHIKDEISTISDGLENPDIRSSIQQHSDYQSLSNRYKKLQTFIRSLDHYLGQDNLLESTDPYPVNIKEIIDKLSDTMRPSAARRLISITTIIPEDLPLALVVPNRFIDFFENLLQILITDGFEGSKITIALTQETGTVICQLKNEGVGMPDDTFQRFLETNAHVDRKDFQAINQIQPELRNWQATLSGSSDFGKGITFKLVLSSFNS